MSSTLVPMSRITHAHVMTSSRDCDGRYEHDYVWTPREGKDFRVLWTEHAASEASITWNFQNRTTRTVDADGYPVLESYFVTDEGYRSEYIRGCDDEDCDPRARRFRDHTAEAAGY